MFKPQDLIDLGLAIEIYADDVGCLENLGDNFQTTYIRWMRTARYCEGKMLVPVPVLRLIRPRGSILKRGGVVETMLQSMPQPSATEAQRPRLHA